MWFEELRGSYQYMGGAQGTLLDAPEPQVASAGIIFHIPPQLFGWSEQAISGYRLATLLRDTLFAIHRLIATDASQLICAGRVVISRIIDISAYSFIHSAGSTRF
jgi:hypothetical protein